MNLVFEGIWFVTLAMVSAFWGMLRGAWMASDTVVTNWLHRLAQTGRIVDDRNIDALRWPLRIVALIVLIVCMIGWGRILEFVIRWILRV